MNSGIMRTVDEGVERMEADAVDGPLAPLLALAKDLGMQLEVTSGEGKPVAASKVTVTIERHKGYAITADINGKVLRNVWLFDRQDLTSHSHERELMIEIDRLHREQPISLASSDVFRVIVHRKSLPLLTALEELSGPVGVVAAALDWCPEPEPIEAGDGKGERWYWSRNEEEWGEERGDDGEDGDGPFASREEARAEGQATLRAWMENYSREIGWTGGEGCVSFFTGRREEIDPAASVNTFRIIEDLAEHAQEEVGECADGWLAKITCEQEEDLEARVGEAVKQWLEAWGLGPKFWKVEDIEWCQVKGGEGDGSDLAAKA